MSPYSDEFGGAVLNATIDRFAFAFIEPSQDWKIRFIAVDGGMGGYVRLIWMRSAARSLSCMLRSIMKWFANLAAAVPLR